MNRPSPALLVLALVMAGLVAWAGWGAWASWRLAGDTHMSVHGWIAMGIAAVFTGLLAGGLIWLAFYSSRHGFDDEGFDDEPLDKSLGESSLRPHPSPNSKPDSAGS